jgi:predicted transport protein
VSDLKLFQIQGDKVTKLDAETSVVEKSLQQLFEKHLDGLLAVRFLASEYVTGKTHGGRIDTLGIDENGSPVIIEYKRRANENVINQGLYYLDWLLDHQGEFELLVSKTLNKEAAEQIDWSAPRLLCIAGDFTRYDEHAVQQIDRNIELLRYRTYKDDTLVAVELLNGVSAAIKTKKDMSAPAISYSTFDGLLKKADADLTKLYEQVRELCLSMGEDVTETERKQYVAFRRLKNFASVEVRPNANAVLVYLKVDPESVELEEGFSRDVRGMGHFGTGDFELRLQATDDLEKAAPFIEVSYEAS